jgi:hypothetical protein
MGAQSGNRRHASTVYKPTKSPGFIQTALQTEEEKSFFLSDQKLRGSREA